MASFDDILNKGKSAVAEASPDKYWQECINSIMFCLHEINGMYGTDKTKHYVEMENAKCEECGKTTFILVVTDLANHNKVLRFHRSEWKYIDIGHYLCEDCK